MIFNLFTKQKLESVAVRTARLRAELAQAELALTVEAESGRGGDRGHEIEFEAGSATADTTTDADDDNDGDIFKEQDTLVPARQRKRWFPSSSSQPAAHHQVQVGDDSVEGKSSVDGVKPPNGFQQDPLGLLRRNSQWASHPPLSSAANDTSATTFPGVEGEGDEGDDGRSLLGKEAGQATLPTSPMSLPSPFGRLNQLHESWRDRRSARPNPT
jgi:hypothetical protein